MLSQLCLLLALALPGWLPAADDEAEDADLAHTKLCESKPDSDDDAAGEVCEQPVQDLTEEARQEIITEITEDTQNAYTLRKLLLGRNYVFFGRVELEYAFYSGDIPSSENGGDLRRLRFGIAGLATFFDRVSYKFELDRRHQQFFGPVCPVGHPQARLHQGRQSACVPESVGDDEFAVPTVYGTALARDHFFAETPACGQLRR